MIVATALAVAAVAAAGGEARNVASGGRSLTIYAKPSTIEFMNHADDRVRGMAANPFAANAQALVLVTKGAEKGNGPFPGDDVLYTFKLYPDAGLSKSNGTATFTCYYTFAKRATCEAYFRARPTGICGLRARLSSAAPDFTLSASGGTEGVSPGSRRGRAVTAVIGTGKAERLDFVLLRS